MLLACTEQVIVTENGQKVKGDEASKILSIQFTEVKQGEEKKTQFKIYN